MRFSTTFALAALSALALAGCATSPAIGTSTKGLEIPIEKAAVKFAADLKAGGYKVVTTDELKKWLDDGRKITIVSSMPAAEDRSLGVLPGAANAAMPKTEQDLTPEDKEHMLMAAGGDKGSTIVVYCGFVACRRSHIGAKMLVDNGYRNVYRYPAGIAGWSEAGYGLAK
jgi:rhodanese-related sulfurtransferase